jgi:hypothetical protein
LVAFTLAVIGCLGGSPALAGVGLPTGETRLGQSLIEPAYDYTTGQIIYLLTPEKSPFPTDTSSHAVAPLYLVEYPPGSNVGTLNCIGVPGNCPDHDAAVAGAAVSIGLGMFGPSSPYGTDPTKVPGHDHLVGLAATGGDFNIAWEVWEILFTPKAVADGAITHLTTTSQINTALANGYITKPMDLGFAFHCSVVSAAAYNAGTPI